MEVWMDGKPLGGELAGATLQEVLNCLMENSLAKDRTMSEVRVNGQPFEEAVLGSAQLLPRERIDRLEVETMDSRQVALHFLANAGGYLAAIIASLEKVAELFRVSDEGEASEHYLHTLDSLQLFLQVLQSCREALELDFDAITLEGMSAEDRLRGLSTLVQELLAAQEQQDWVLLADILQYDLTAELKAWTRHLAVLREMSLT